MEQKPVFENSLVSAFIVNDANYVPAHDEEEDGLGEYEPDAGGILPSVLMK